MPRMEEREFEVSILKYCYFKTHHYFKTYKCLRTNKDFYQNVFSQGPINQLKYK